MSLNMLNKILSVLLHVCGILALSELCVSRHLGIEVLKTVECSAGNGTCSWARLVDLLPVPLLQLDVGLALKWTALIVAACYSLYVSITVYKIFFSHVDEIYHQNTRDIGYMVAPGRSKKEVANMIRRRRRLGDIPPLYPNAWYEVMRSEELPIGAVKAVHLIGQHFAVFRGENGQVSVLDAYCPHLGANLGVGGRVINNCIECPFHGWQFDGQSGKCVSIPYSSKVPSIAKTKVWPSVEYNGVIFLWFDAEGRDPLYQLSEIEEVKCQQWTYRGRLVHYVTTHLEEISENGADVAHLKCLHEAGTVAGPNLNHRSSLLADLITHHWNVNWEPLPPPQGHVGRMTLSVTNKILGRVVKPLSVTVITDQVGPTVVYLKFRFLFGSGVWLETIVPEEPMFLRMTTYVFADWWIPTFIVTSALKGMGVQIERDVHVWNNKTYLSRPLLVKEDHLIQAHRRWFSQFYSENSPRLELKKDDLTW